MKERVSEGVSEGVLYSRLSCKRKSEDGNAARNASPAHHRSTVHPSETSHTTGW